MTILERKAIAIQQLLNTDEQQFERLEQFIKTLGPARLPGQESVEEMREGVRRATEKYYNSKEGYITHEEMIAQFQR